MELLLLFFLAASLVLYVVFGGADFGAGILELFPSPLHRERRLTINRALAPVWEANHVWLIVAVVILFTGFPVAFAAITTYFHIPLTIMLIGIIFRGCAFTFRFYDPFKDESHRLYTRLFVASSILCPLSMGWILAGMTSGALNTHGSFFDAYVLPWFSLYGFTLGLFVMTIFAHLAAVFLIGETQVPSLRAHFAKYVRGTSGAVVLSGLLVFIVLALSRHTLWQEFFRDVGSLSAFLIATTLFWPLFWGIRHEKVQLIRVIAAVQIVCVLAGWLWHQYPTILMTDRGAITMYDAMAGGATVRTMVIALCVGSLLIFPGLFYLYKTFKLKP